MNKLLNSFGYAFNGLAVAFKEQLNIRVHVLASVLVIALGFYFGVTLTEWSILILTITLVISLELINTALENLVDLVSPTQNPLAGKIKDVAAAAVLIAATGAITIGIFIFGKYIIQII